MAKERTGWSGLSQATRSRYERGGITRADWEGGADLRAARGHAPPAPAGAAPVAATDRYVHGRGTEADYRELATWRRSEAPGWLPSPAWIADDTAASLSTLRPPNQWQHVHLTPSSGDVWTMRVDYKRGYSEQVDIPAGSASEVLELLSAAGHGQADMQGLGIDEGDWEDYWEDWYDQDLDFDVGYGDSAP